MEFSNLPSGFFLILSLFAVLVSGSRRTLPIIPFDEGYTQLFGDDNLVIHKDGKKVHLSLDETTGPLFFLFGVVLIVVI